MLPDVLDRAFTAIFRNFSTLFLVALFVAGPLHIGHAVVFQRVISVAELHPEIETFPKERQVKSVGKTQLGDYRKMYGTVLLIELLLLPILAGAARRTFRDDEKGEVPTATGSWKGALGETKGVLRSLPGALPLVLAGALAALLIGYLAERLGLTLSEFFTDDTRFVGVGLTHALAHALALPLLFGAWAAAPSKGSPKVVEPPLELY